MRKLFNSTTTYRSKLNSLWNTYKPTLTSIKPLPPSNLQTVTSMMGIERFDPFGKLSLESAEGREYLKAETKLFEKSFKIYRDLLDEIDEVCEVASSVAPSAKEEIVEEGKEFVVYRVVDGAFFFRDKLTQEKVLLFRPSEINLLSHLLAFKPPDYTKSSKYKLVKLQVSRCLRFLGVTINLPSEEVGTLFLIDRSPSEVTPGPKVTIAQQPCHIIQVIPDVFNFLLVNNQHAVYTKVSPQLRPYKVQKFCLNQHKTTELLVDEDTANFMDIGLTRDHQYVTINSNSLTSSTIYISPVNNLTQTILFHRPKLGVECFVDHVKDQFVILSNYVDNKKADQFHLYTIRDTPQLLSDIHNSNRSWVDQAQLVKLGLGEKWSITDVELFSNFALIYSLDAKVNSKLAIYNWQTQSLTTVSGLPEVAIIQPNGQFQDFDSSFNSIRISSPTIPPQLVPINLSKASLSGKICSLPSQSTRSAFSSAYSRLFITDFCTSQLKASSPDSRNSNGYRAYKVFTLPHQTSPAIPITIIESSQSQNNPNAPVLMVGYGAYGVNLLPEFRPHYFPLIHRGWKVALVHIRGGSELGSHWYEQGRGSHKLNSSLDFLSAAHYFRSQSLTRHLVASASSAGAVAVVGAVQQHPDWFKAMTLRVPFLNVLDSMLDPSSPLTEVEYIEWGNPTKNRDELVSILNYSPYDTLSQVSPSSPFPAVFIMAGLQDLRINPLTSLKYLAKLRHIFPNLPSDHFLLHLDPSYGHHIQDTTKYYKTVAQELEFILKHAAWPGIR